MDIGPYPLSEGGPSFPRANDGQGPLRLPVWPARFCVAVCLVADQDTAEVGAGPLVTGREKPRPKTD
jgi:hypothetical protein